jgi:hypothetical protein
MPPQQSIRRDYGAEFAQGFAPYRLGLARQKSTLSVCEPDSLSSQPFFEQLILGLEKFDDEQLMPMDPARHNYKQKRQQWRHRTHAMPAFYRDPSFEFMDNTGSSNPTLGDLAKLANAGRGIPAPPDRNSATASNLTMQKLMGLLTEAIPGGFAAMTLHGATGGGLAPEALAAGLGGGVLPFAAANYGTKAYLSGAAARYAQGGIPTLADIINSLAPAGGAAVPALAGAMQGP